MNTIIIFVKHPEPGKVKTRLGKFIGYEKAAELYRVFIEQTFEIAGMSEADQVFLAVEPPDKIDFFKRLAPPSYHCFPQFGSDLGTRLMAAFKTTFGNHSSKVIAIGSDSPTLPVDSINDAFVRLSETELVLGPADDGGYYLIGMKRLLQPVFENIPWSSNTVVEATLSQADKHHIPYHVLSPWYDVDDETTLLRAAQDDASGKIRSYMEKEIQTMK